MMSTIMKQLLCTFFVVLTYTTFTGADAYPCTALTEIFSNAKQLKRFGQIHFPDTRDSLRTPVNIELSCSAHLFKKELESLKQNCMELAKAKAQNTCIRYIRIISRNMKNVKHYPECEYEEKSFTDFMSQLILFSQKKRSECK